MQRRIDMRAGMLVHGQVQKIEPVIGEIENLFCRDPRIAEIGWKIRAVSMRQILDAPMPLRHRGWRAHG